MNLAGAVADAPQAPVEPRPDRLVAQLMRAPGGGHLSAGERYQSPPRFPALRGPVAPARPGHGCLTRLEAGANGTSGTIDATLAGADPLRALLTAAIASAPCEDVRRFTTRIPCGLVGVPSEVHQVQVFEPLPAAGPVEVEARFAGLLDDDPDHPCFDVQLIAGDQVKVAFRLVETMS
jgi:hypothetical protein